MEEKIIMLYVVNCKIGDLVCDFEVEVPGILSSDRFLRDEIINQIANDPALKELHGTKNVDIKKYGAKKYKWW